MVIPTAQPTISFRVENRLIDENDIEEIVDQAKAAHESMKGNRQD